MTKSQANSYGGVRKKLMGAVAMLLVASIMVVSSTYAWFTLSTAPEITGISTSVGANGNLEIALLNSESGTWADMTKISSAVGDSSASQAVTAANLTWGNLVDLSDTSYGLQSINLMPSRLNFRTSGGGSDPIVYDAKNVVVNNLLRTAVYGADGRVKDVSGMTYSSGTFADNSWKYNPEALTYGVRAIGANDNLTAQETGIMSAKTAYNSLMNEARTTVSSAISSNGSAMADAMMKLVNDPDAELSDNETAAVVSLVNAAEASLEKIDKAYMEVLKALVATAISDVPTYNAAVASINDAGSYAAATDDVPSQVNIPEVLADAATALTAQKANVAAAKADITAATPNYKAALAKLVDSEKVTVNGYEDTDMKDESGLTSAFVSSVLKGGINVEMPDNSGVFAYIGSVAGNYGAVTSVDLSTMSDSFAGVEMDATLMTTATQNTAVKTLVSAATAAQSTGGSGSALSDTYGYAVDFAVRTNAASSYLQLQTDARQRVYADGESDETLGGGSTMTFKSAVDGDQALLADAQVGALMQAIRVAFINPVEGTIYGIASLDEISAGANAGEMTGKLTLKNYSITAATGVLTLSAMEDKQETEQDERVALLQLEQNTATKVTVVVWLDGDMVDNSDVANAAQSIVGSMNLQFSSSATLIPMENTALRTIESAQVPEPTQGD